MTSTADYYGISGKEEAKAYLADPYLSNNLITISKALLELPGNDPSVVMGYPDDLKLRSSMTLFYMTAEDERKEVFQAVLKKYYKGEPDQKTIALLG